MPPDRRWWDRWTVGFWGGVALASILYPFMHPPVIQVTRLSAADIEKIAEALAASVQGTDL